MIDLDIRTLGGKVGEEVAVSDWIEIAQETIDRFADATGDHQWIHVDPARAAVESPFKGTIAHGFLTLSLISTMLRSVVRPIGIRMAINYGLNRVRFMAPVVSGSRVRGRFAVAAVEETGGSLQVTWRTTVEREHEERPCCVADWLVRYYVGSESSVLSPLVP